MSTAVGSHPLPSIRESHWIRIAGWLIILSLVPAFVVASTSPKLELALFDRVRLSPTMLGEMEGEVQRVLVAREVEIHWLAAKNNLVSYSPRREIQVILSPSLPEAWGYDESVMGAVLAPRREQPGGVIVVFPARVAQVVGARQYKNFSDRLPRDSRLARALGRVIAHEIIHVVAPEHGHGDDGIMHASQSHASLLEPEPRVDTVCSAAFQTRLPEYLARLGLPAPTTFSAYERPAISTPE
ncbi:MAG: hypothetical protein WBG67_08815 [Thermoanaerobaculia bacterium]